MLGALGALAVVATIERTLGVREAAMLLYVVPVVLAAGWWGRGPAIVAAVTSVLGQDLLLVEPRGTLIIARPDDAIGLLLLFFVALATAQLADSARRGQEHAREADVARRSEQLKTALLRAVSHDLRTPLSAIKAGASGLLADDAAYAAEDRRETLTAIEEEADRLDRLVGNLLDASQVEAGAIRPHVAAEDLGEILRDVLRRKRALLAERPVALDIPESLPLAWCDRALVAQALSNLVENAAVHTPPESGVRLCIRADRHHVAVVVEDDGPGIAAEDRPRLFRAFERGRRAGGGGTGLGLAIARGFAEAQGGTLRAEDGASGGARLVLSLPLAPVDTRGHGRAA